MLGIFANFLGIFVKIFLVTLTGDTLMLRWRHLSGSKTQLQKVDPLRVYSPVIADFTLYVSKQPILLGCENEGKCVNRREW